MNSDRQAHLTSHEKTANIEAAIAMTIPISSPGAMSITLLNIYEGLANLLLSYIPLTVSALLFSIIGAE